MRRCPILLVAACLAMLCLSCEPTETTTPMQRASGSYVLRDEAVGDVTAAAIDTIAADWHAGLLRVVDSTFTPPFDQEMATSYVTQLLDSLGVRPETRTDFLAHMRMADVAVVGPTRVGLIRVRANDPDGCSTSCTPKALDQHEVPLVVLNGVGLSAARGQALVELGVYCGPMCATGYLIVLDRVRGSWRVGAVRSLWVS